MGTEGFSYKTAWTQFDCETHLKAAGRSSEEDAALICDRCGRPVPTVLDLLMHEEEYGKYCWWATKFYCGNYADGNRENFLVGASEASALNLDPR